MKDTQSQDEDLNRAPDQLVDLTCGWDSNSKSRDKTADSKIKTNYKLVKMIT